MIAGLPPVPMLELPAWSDDQRSRWRSHADRASALSEAPGTGCDFSALVVQAQALLRAQDPTPLLTRLEDRRFVRALVTAWHDDDALARETMSPELLDRLARPGVSRLTTILLAMLFCAHVDLLDDWRQGLFAAVRDTLRAAVAAQAASSGPDLVETLRQHDAHLLDRDGPRQLAAALVASGTDVTAWFRAAHLTAVTDTRLGWTVRDAFYLARIEAADAAAGDHSFLDAVRSEVVSRQRTQTTVEDGRYFGHAVLAAMTAKPVRRPSTPWLETALAIGGDPRRRQTSQWRTWWSALPAENLARAQRWMSGVDLAAFLDGVQAFAHETSNIEMQRMLERRKRLLTGLYEQDRVDDVRLILGRDIRAYFRRSTHLGLQDVAMLQDPGANTAVIYVDCGDFCLVEGSHNFKLHLYTGGALPRLADRSNVSFDLGFLRQTVPFRHVEAHGPESHLAVSHQGGEWIRRALDHLREQGVRVDERGLMTDGDFADLSRRRVRTGY